MAVIPISRLLRSPVIPQSLSLSLRISFHHGKGFPQNPQNLAISPSKYIPKFGSFSDSSLSGALRLSSAPVVVSKIVSDSLHRLPSKLRHCGNLNSTNPHQGHLLVGKMVIDRMRCQKNLKCLGWHYPSS